MLVSQAHSFTQQARLSITLAWVAGYTNILTLIICNTVTSHVTGNASALGRDLVERNWPHAGFMFYLLAMFACGAALSGILTETGRRRGWESIYVLPMLVEAGLLTSFAVGLELHDPEARAAGGALWWLTGVASLAMGVQNATITRISSGVVRTTHLTGVLTDLGTETVQFVLWLRDRSSSGPPLPMIALAHSVRVHPSARRLALLASIVGSFSLGAGLGTLAHDHWPRVSMIPPVLFLLWIVSQDIKTPICEIEPLSVGPEGHEIALPHGLAVFHLRKDKDRSGPSHRMPDLLRWCERLPRAHRVVVLDLGAVSELDDNAALEMRALIKQAAANGRTLIIAGLTSRQYDAVRAAGAGDVLDSGNVCSDLELAIARGMVMLEDLLQHEQPRKRR